jgi:hypothetical protein
LSDATTTGTRSFDVVMTAHVRVTVKDPLVIRRVTENIDGWREHLYDISTGEQVLEMLAYNAVRNGVDRANRLDGWADLASDAATMDVVDAEFEYSDEVS